MSGIVRYGTYIPYSRLTREALGGGRGERAAASYDEDSVSMAVEAGRDALRDGAEATPRRCGLGCGARGRRAAADFRRCPQG